MGRAGGGLRGNGASNPQDDASERDGAGGVEEGVECCRVVSRSQAVAPELSRRDGPSCSMLLSCRAATSTLGLRGMCHTSKIKTLNP